MSVQVYDETAGRQVGVRSGGGRGEVGCESGHGRGAGCTNSPCRGSLFCPVRGICRNERHGGDFTTVLVVVPLLVVAEEHCHG